MKYMTRPVALVLWSDFKVNLISHARQYAQYLIISIERPLPSTLGRASLGRLPSHPVPAESSFDGVAPSREALCVKFGTDDRCV